MVCCNPMAQKLRLSRVRINLNFKKPHTYGPIWPERHLPFSKYLPLLFVSATAFCQDQARPVSVELPEAPSSLIASGNPGLADSYSSSSLANEPQSASPTSINAVTPLKDGNAVELDANGKPIPLELQQPKRILGFMPNFRSVSGGAVAHKPGFKYNFQVATRQAFDWSSFVFLGITSASAEGINSHPALGKGIGGFYAYTWRGLIDKTDGTYLQAWLLPSILHEDTRYYGLGRGSVFKRSLYVISRQGVARTYGGRQTPNIAGLGGKVLTQVISRQYYPSSAATFSTLATKFGYSVMRDVAFTSIREFYPSIAAHYVKKHREHQAQRAQAQP